MNSSSSWRRLKQYPGVNPHALSEALGEDYTKPEWTGEPRAGGVDSLAPKSGTGATANRTGPDNTRKVGS